MDPIAHTTRCNGEHPAQLATAQNSDSRTRKNLSEWLTQGNCSVITRSVWLWRYCFSFSRSCGREFASMATASRAALVAPALPIASVPTGTPAGICTIERRSPLPLVPDFLSELREQAALSGLRPCPEDALRRLHRR